MYVDFDLLPDHSRAWVYQGSRKFTPEEEKVIERNAHVFCLHWEAHGNPLRTSFQIRNHQFLLLAVDEGLNDASGCSIDGSVRMLKTFEGETGIDFLDHSKIAFLINDEVELIPTSQLKDAFISRQVDADTLTFATQATDLGILRRGWLLEAGKTWLARYLPKSSVV